MKKNCFKFISGSAAALMSCVMAAVCLLYAALPCDISVQAGNTGIDCAKSLGGFSGTVLKESGGELVYFFGNIPIKAANAVEKERASVVLCGTPFGVKVKASGVMVISAAEHSPAFYAGIKAGDVITDVNGKKVSTNAEFAEAVQLDEEMTKIVLNRDGGEMCLSVFPERHGDMLRLGLYVRDSAAGIGTLTFCDKKTGCFGGLGHAVSDAATGGEIPLKSGEITSAEIFDVVKGKEGSAGELCGRIHSDDAIGELSHNTSAGVFGRLYEPPSGREYPEAFRQEVHTGAAAILATTSEEGPREYSIEIERINLFGLEGSKSMVIRITDEELLEKTGGIVRGMSGSPIIQDGRFAGAVTHVLVNDPTRGYAVFAENMIDIVRS